MYSTTIELGLTLEVGLRAEDAATAARQAQEIIDQLVQGGKLEHVEGLRTARYHVTGDLPKVTAN
jgi:polyhydroxyalkanoate synthesis regulator phasin